MKSFDMVDKWDSTIEVAEDKSYIDIYINNENICLTIDQANEFCQQLEDMLGRNEE